MDKISFTGGSIVGAAMAAHPMASLTISSQKILLSSYGKMVTFLPSDVIALPAHGGISFGRNGVRIVHNRQDCPENVVFWCPEGRDALLESFIDCGFVPAGIDIQRPKGIAVRWSAIVVCAVLWLWLFKLASAARAISRERENFYLMLIIASVFAIALAVRKLPAVQSLVLKKGRSLDDIKPLLHRMLWISAFLLVAGATIGGLVNMGRHA